MAVLNHQMIDALGIVHNGWVSISEIGFYDDNVETYQFTPIRKRINAKCEVSEDKLIFGACKSVELPVVIIPRMIDVEYHVLCKREHLNSPDFEAYIGPILRYHPEFSSTPGLVGLLFHGYMNHIEKKYPQGYLVLADLDRSQVFDINMRNAKAVLLNTLRNPIEALNHNTSRLIYKAPVLVVGDISQRIEDGEIVKFSCDGSNFKLR